MIYDLKNQRSFDHHATYLRKFCRFPYGTYSITSAIGSDRVQAPDIDTMLGWEPIFFIRLISAKRSSLQDNGALSVKSKLILIKPCKDGRSSKRKSLIITSVYFFFLRGGGGLFVQNIQFLYYRGKNCIIIYILWYAVFTTVYQYIKCSTVLTASSLLPIKILEWIKIVKKNSHIHPQYV